MISKANKSILIFCVFAFGFFISNTYSEIVKNSSNTDPDAAQIAAITTLAYLDGEQENIPFSGSINASNTIITINPNNDMEEWRPIGITVVNGLQDTLGNIANGSAGRCTEYKENKH